MCPWGKSWNVSRISLSRPCVLQILRPSTATITNCNGHWSSEDWVTPVGRGESDSDSGDSDCDTKSAALEKKYIYL